MLNKNIEKAKEYVKENFDCIVIGGGTSGIGAAKQLQKNGYKVLIVEKDDFKTTCANVGCMPSKLLLSPAKDSYRIKNSRKKYIDSTISKIDDEKIMSHLRSERDRFVGFVKESASEINNRIIGYANIINKNTIAVKIENKEFIFNTKTIIIATGSYPIISKEFEDYKDKILTNENVFELKNLPKSILIVGAGVIGLELGSALSNLGVKTTIYSMDKSLFGLDEEIKNSIIDSQTENYEKMIFNQTIKKVSFHNNLYKIEFNNNDIVEVESVLLSIGRIPNLESVGFKNLFKENINLKEILKTIDKNNLNIKDYDINNVFIAGDANSIEPLLHTASDDSTRAANSVINYLDNKNIENKRTKPLSIIFTIPYQISFGGENKNYDYSVIFDWKTQGRSRVDGKNFGKLKLCFEKDSLIGYENIGPDSEHIAHLLSWQIESKNNKIDNLLSMPYYHPVIQEGLRTAFRMAKEKYLNNKY